MKLIVATIRPEKLVTVREALDDADVSLMYAGFVVDAWRRRPCMYRGVEYQACQPRLRVEVLVGNEALVSDTVAAIAKAASVSTAGPRGSGDIIVLAAENWVSIRPGFPAAEPHAAERPETVNTLCALHK